MGGARTIVCRNEAEAKKDRADRRAIVANLEKWLSGGDKALADLCRSHQLTVEWGDPICDLDRPREATFEKESRRVTTRTHVEGQVGLVFQAVGVALPANRRERPA